MVYCDTGNSKTIEYPLLQEFFETAGLEFELEERFVMEVPFADVTVECNRLMEQL